MRKSKSFIDILIKISPSIEPWNETLQSIFTNTLLSVSKVRVDLNKRFFINPYPTNNLYKCFLSNICDLQFLSHFLLLLKLVAGCVAPFV